MFHFLPCYGVAGCGSSDGWMAAYFSHDASPHPMQDMELTMGEPFGINPPTFAEQFLRRKSRGRKPRKRNRVNKCPSDGLTLAEREDVAREMLTNVGINACQITLEEAIAWHIISEDNEFKRGLRVAVAANRITGKTTELLHCQLGTFLLDLDAIVTSCGADDMKARNIRALFVKSALHRVDPETHECRSSKSTGDEGDQ
jgi:hypothetical protein